MSFRNELFSEDKLRAMSDSLTPSKTIPFDEGYDYCPLRLSDGDLYDSLPSSFVPISKMLIYYDGNPDKPLSFLSLKYDGNEAFGEEKQAIRDQIKSLSLSEEYVDAERVYSARARLMAETGIDDDFEIQEYKVADAARVGQPLGQLVLWGGGLDALYDTPVTATLTYDLVLGPDKLVKLLRGNANGPSTHTLPGMPTNKRARKQAPKVRRKGFPTNQGESSIPTPPSFTFSRSNEKSVLTYPESAYGLFGQFPLAEG